MPGEHHDHPDHPDPRRSESPTADGPADAEQRFLAPEPADSHPGPSDSAETGSGQSGSDSPERAGHDGAGDGDATPRLPAPPRSGADPQGWEPAGPDGGAGWGSGRPEGPPPPPLGAPEAPPHEAPQGFGDQPTQALGEQPTQAFGAQGAWAQPAGASSWPPSQPGPQGPQPQYDGYQAGPTQGYPPGPAQQFAEPAAGQGYGALGVPPAGGQQWASSSQYPGQPFETPPPSGKRPSRRWIIAVIAIGVVIALVIVGIVLLRQAAERREAEERAQAEQARVEAAGETVEVYLTAVGDGELATATAQLDEVPESVLISEEVLAASVEQGGVTGISVGTAARTEESGPFTVPASYLVGETQVETQFVVLEDAGGGFVIALELPEVAIVDDLEKFEPTVNGVEVTAGRHAVLPGTYSLAIGSENFELDGTTTIAVGADQVDFDALATVSEEGTTAFREAVIAAVEECVASSSIDAGCGLSFETTLGDRDGGEDFTMVDGTIERSLPASTADALATMEPTIVAGTGSARGTFAGAVDTTAGCTQGAASGTCRVDGTMLSIPTVDLLDPALPVSWL